MYTIGDTLLTSPPSNSQLEKMEKDLASWTRALDIDGTCKIRLVISQVGRLAAMAYPDAAPEMLLLGAKFLTWLFAFDGEFLEESSKSHHEKIRTIKEISYAAPGKDAGIESEMLRVFFELSNEIALSASEAQFSRITNHLRSALFAALLESASAQRHTGLNSISAYLATRRDSSGVLLCFSMAEVLSGFIMPEEKFYEPRVTALRNSACDAIVWSNDTFSHAKEEARQNTLGVLNILENQGMGLEEALLCSTEKHQEIIFRFIKLRKAASQEAGSGEYCYVNCLWAWISANHHWSSTTPPYSYNC
ncbi:hypothetical protein [Streptomyces sp. NPDC058701]|uniref:terpene synthase family protein n=1 Tax=Streptomyces sp. NPDC058701 TaxID=3346608 RepID=UPI00364B83EF